MSSAVRKWQTGSNVLEIAGILVMLLPLLIGITAIADYVLLTYKTGRILERTLLDQHLKAFRLEASGAVSLNKDVLQAALSAYASRAEASLREAFGSDELLQQEYRLEIEMVSVEIDPDTGHTRRVTVLPQLRQARGALQISTELASRTDLRAEYDRLAGPVGEASPLAITLMQGLGSDARYFPASVLIGARIFVSFESSPTAHALSSLGVIQSPITFDWKALPVRGEVEAL